MDSKHLKIVKRWLKDNLRNMYWSVHGGSIKNPGMPPAPSSCLFVCKGNICRSPFAEYLAREIAQASGAGGWIRFGSAGLHAGRPLPSPANAVEAARAFGIRLDGHRSKGVTPELMESYDMVLAMEPWQLQTLREGYPQFMDKVFLLSLFGGPGGLRGSYDIYNIRDPYGGSVDTFHACFSRIETCLKGLFAEASRMSRGEEITVTAGTPEATFDETPAASHASKPVFDE